MSPDQFQDESLGNVDSVYTTDTAAVTGRFFAIQALADTVIATLVAPRMTGTLTSIPVPAGVVIYSQINGYTLASGKVIAYKRKG